MITIKMHIHLYKHVHMFNVWSCLPHVVSTMSDLGDRTPRAEHADRLAAATTPLHLLRVLPRFHGKEVSKVGHSVVEDWCLPVLSGT